MFTLELLFTALGSSSLALIAVKILEYRKTRAEAGKLGAEEKDALSNAHETTLNMMHKLLQEQQLQIISLKTQHDLEIQGVNYRLEVALRRVAFLEEKLTELIGDQIFKIREEFYDELKKSD